MSGRGWLPLMKPITLGFAASADGVIALGPEGATGGGGGGCFEPNPTVSGEAHRFSRVMTSGIPRRRPWTVRRRHLSAGTAALGRVTCGVCCIAEGINREVGFGRSSNEAFNSLIVGAARRSSGRRSRYAISAASRSRHWIGTSRDAVSGRRIALVTDNTPDYRA